MTGVFGRSVNRDIFAGRRLPVGSFSLVKFGAVVAGEFFQFVVVVGAKGAKLQICSFQFFGGDRKCCNPSYTLFPVIKT